MFCMFIVNELIDFWGLFSTEEDYYVDSWPLHTYMEGVLVRKSEESSYHNATKGKLSDGWNDDWLLLENATKNYSSGGRNPLLPVLKEGGPLNGDSVPNGSTVNSRYSDIVYTDIRDVLIWLNESDFFVKQIVKFELLQLSLAYRECLMRIVIIRLFFIY